MLLVGWQCYDSRPSACDPGRGNFRGHLILSQFRKTSGLHGRRNRQQAIQRSAPCRPALQKLNKVDNLFQLSSGQLLQLCDQRDLLVG